MIAAAGRRRHPAGLANRARNALGDEARRRRWAPARDAAWALLERHVDPGAELLVAGAGNGDDLPLGRLLERASRVVLCDVDTAAARRALRRRAEPLRRRGEVVRADVTDGAADRVVRAAAAGRGARAAAAPAACLPGGPADVVVADLLYTQLLYPALLDAGLSGPRIASALERYGPTLTGSVVARLHATVRPGGVAIHLHDALGWWEGHPQPFTLDDVLAVADEGGAECALALVAGGQGPRGCDVLGAVRASGAEVLDTALWRWPFRDGVDYLVAGVVARTPPLTRTWPASCAGARRAAPR